MQHLLEKSNSPIKSAWTFSVSENITAPSSSTPPRQ